MEAISDAATETVVIMSSSQVGKTEMVNNAVGYHIDQDPAPIMVVMPTERDAETWSKDRFSPMARDTPCLQDKIGNPKSRDGNNKILHKRFPGGHLTIVGANAPSGLASRPIRLLLCDEVDRYPFSAGAEGDPVNLAKKRTVTFWNRKIVLVSTPTNKGASRIEAAFEESDQRRYWVPCPDCGHEQILTWGQVKWDKDENGGHRPETARYQCADCGAPWSDETRWAAISKGCWIAEAPFTGTAGFHLNEIYSPWVRLEAMAKAFLSARAGGDETMKTFVNTSLGETWMESGEAPDWQRLQGLKEDWRAGTVPTGGLFLTAGADVQKDRIEVDVWAWGRGLQSWLIDHIVIEGGPDRSCMLAETLLPSWPDMGSYKRRTDEHRRDLRLIRGMRPRQFTLGRGKWALDRWRRSKALKVLIERALLQGQHLLMRPLQASVCAAVHGFGLWQHRPLKLRPIASCGLIRRMLPARRTGKSILAGFLHLPGWVDAEWLKQLTAEQLVTVKNKRGFAKLEWQKLRERNEALDCRVYARAAAWILGADRWSDARWEELASEFDPEAEAQAQIKPTVLRGRKGPQRRVMKSNYMG